MSTKNRVWQQTLLFVLLDWLAAVLAWTGFYALRVSATDRLAAMFTAPTFWHTVLAVSVCWILFYAFVGSYHKVFHKSRIKETASTLILSVMGCIVVGLCFLHHPVLGRGSHYLFGCFLYLVLHFLFTFLFRIALTARIVRRVHNRTLGFPTLLVGSGEKALATYEKMDRQEVYSGNCFCGFVATGADEGCEADAALRKKMQCLGTVDDIQRLVEQHAIEEVIVALSPNDPLTIQKLLVRMASCRGITVKAAPNRDDLLLGRLRVDNPFHTPLIVIGSPTVGVWQARVKRLFDIVVSVIALVTLSPVYLLTAIGVKLSSRGPVFYAQERVGRWGRPFKMYKFRSMYTDAEAEGPALSSDDDPRITPFGRFMRKVRLDEIPQFYNVLRGTMSIVGPRPERQFYIDQIVQKAPEYLLLQRVKPGITSWGQVKYGYASDVDQMVERVPYDLLYLENMSLITDLRILMHTVLIVLSGRGK